MNRELLSKAFGDMDESFVLEAYRPVPEDVSSSSERIVHMKKKRMITFALAVALMLALGITAYAAWNIHAARQQELKADLKIDENNVSSYMEYDVRDEQASSLVLLSAVNDGKRQRIYVNISPISEEEAATYQEFSASIDGTNILVSASPLEPAGQNLSGSDEIRSAVLQRAYNKETQTMTLQCFLHVNTAKQALTDSGADTLPLSVHMIVDGRVARSFGPIPISLTAEQHRVFDFGHILYHDTEFDKEIEIVGLELTPFSAVWKVHYEGDAAAHAPETAWEAYEPWCNLEDKVCQEAKIVFSDGSEFSSGGALTSYYENGMVNLWCDWSSSINMDDIQQIVLGDQILWEAK